jgi:UDP-N-acetyl-2-amino-2-deoxyglucuronate dehydrogenase
LHPAIIALKEKIQKSPGDKIHHLNLTYITSRGKWYYRSWKGNVEKSGGIATNIGVHFFDMLTWIFGSVRENKIHVLTPDRAAGYLHLEKAEIRWFLSLNYNDIPAEVKNKGKTTYRALVMDDHEIEFTEGFTDLHTVSYRHILDGKGFGLEDGKPAIEIVYLIRNAAPIGLKGDYHPLLNTIKGSL